MSKLAHSHQPTMDEIESRRLIEEGYTFTCPRCGQVVPHGFEPDGCEDFDCPLLEPGFWDENRP